MPNDIHIGNSFGWNTELLLEFLVGNPLERYIGKFFESRTINLGIVNPYAHMQGVVVHSRIAFLHTHIHAVRMAGRIEPGPVIHADAIDTDCEAPVPIPSGIT